MTANKKITYLGCGSWGFCLAHHLAQKGYQVTSWTTQPQLAQTLNKDHIHPRFPNITAPDSMLFTTDLHEALKGADVVIESVTAAGLREVCENLKQHLKSPIPLILTSKGIEQGTHCILSAVAVAVLGENFRPSIGSLSGPSYADEVIQGLPTSVVATGYSPETIELVAELFHTSLFRVYPNSDIVGVSYGGALKNIIAIACGIADALQFGTSARAALMTRGLHEVKKLAIAQGAKSETLSGLAGMGDLFLTCSSSMSRNFRFGQLLAQGMTKQQALEKVGMVVEGAYTCTSALQISKQLNIPLPITEAISQIIEGTLTPAQALEALMRRTIKEEHL